MNTIRMIKLQADKKCSAQVYNLPLINCMNFNDTKEEEFFLKVITEV